MFYKTLHRKVKIENTHLTKTNNDLQNTTQKSKDWVTQTSPKTNNDIQNTTQKSKDWETHTSLKINNDLQNTTQKSKEKDTCSVL
jgi:hypothetical protein